MNINMYIYTYTYTYIYTHTCIFHVRVHIHVRVRVCLCVFLLCGAVSCAARRWVVGWLGVGRCGAVWCGVVRCGVCVVVDPLERARAERSMIERRVGQCMECVVLAILKTGRIQ